MAAAASKGDRVFESERRWRHFYRVYLVFLLRRSGWPLSLPVVGIDVVLDGTEF